jgi:hypothetical protein
MLEFPYTNSLLPALREGMGSINKQTKQKNKYKDFKVTESMTSHNNPLPTLPTSSRLPQKKLL